MILFEKKKAKSPDLGDPFLLWQGAKSNIELAAFLKNGRDKEARGAIGDSRVARGDFTPRPSRNRT
jgi:hypothetical protein